MTELINNLAIISKNAAGTLSNHQHHSEISCALQKSLYFNELIRIFSTKIQQLVPHNGYFYTNSVFDINIFNGIQSNNYCRYRLTSEDFILGELKLMRQNHFGKAEIYLLETLLSYLITPLTNATLFNQSLTMAYTDISTLTHNRPAFNEAIKREITIARRYSLPLSLILLDIDNFKVINDTYSYHCGNRVLMAIADCIKSSIRACDTAYRYGGEEFAIVLSNTEIKWATLLSERIRENIENINLNYHNKQIKITASFGTSSISKEDTVNTFINRTDGAMYQAKINGRNLVVTR